MAKAIGTLGNVDSMTVGGVTYVDLTNLIVGTGYTNAVNNRSTVRLPSGSAGYAVTGGKTWTIRSLRIETNLTSANSTGLVGIRYNASDVGINTTNSFGAETRYAADGNCSLIGHFSVVTNSLEIPLFFPIPATKYFSWNHEAASSAVNIFAFGYEV